MYLGFLLGEKLHDSISAEFAVLSIRVMNSRRAKLREDFAPLRFSSSLSAIKWNIRNSHFIRYFCHIQLFDRKDQRNRVRKRDARDTRAIFCIHQPLRSSRWRTQSYRGRCSFFMFLSQCRTCRLLIPHSKPLPEVS